MQAFNNTTISTLLAQSIIQAVIILFIFSPFSGAYAQNVPQREVKLGGIFDLSSAAGQQWGNTEKNAFLLAVEKFQEKNPGLKISYTLEDSAYSNERSVSALQKLVSVEGIKYILGPTWETFSAVLPICEKRRIICLAPSYNTAQFHNPDLKYVFSFWFEDAGYGTVHAGKMNASGYRRIAIFGNTSAYYDAIVDGLLDRLAVKPLLVERVMEKDKDFRALITRTPADIDAVGVFLLGDGQAQAFWKQWHELRKDRPDFFTDDAPLFFDPPLDLGKFGYNIYYSVTDLSGPELEEFNTAYKSRFGEVPAAPSGSVAFDAVSILLDCAGKFDPETDAVRDCIAETNGYAGASGTLSFSGGRTIKERHMKIEKLPLSR